LAPVISLEGNGDKSLLGILNIDLDLEDSLSNVDSATYEIFDSVSTSVLSGSITNVYPDGTFTCVLNSVSNGAFGASKCVATDEDVDVFTLPTGNYEVEVCGTDAAGNTGRNVAPYMSSDIATTYSDPAGVGELRTECLRYPVVIDNVKPFADNNNNGVFDGATDLIADLTLNEGDAIPSILSIGYDDLDIELFCASYITSCISSVNFYNISPLHRNSSIKVSI